MDHPDEDPPTSAVGAFGGLPALSRAAIVIGVAYICWRAGTTWSGTSPVLFVLLLAAEAFGVTRLATELLLAGRGATSPEDAQESNPSSAVASAIIVVADDDPLPVVRDSLVAARLVRGASVVAVVDRNRRREIRHLADRLGIAYLPAAPDAGDGAGIDAVADRFVRLVDTDVVVLCSSDHVLLPHAAEAMASAMTCRRVAAVRGQVDEANAVRRVDRSGLGDRELHDRVIAARLAAAGALTDTGPVALFRRAALTETATVRSADGSSLEATASVLVAAGQRVARCETTVARRLAPGPRALGRHRYGRELAEHLRRLQVQPRPRASTLAGVAMWSPLLRPMRAVQRLALIAVTWGVLSGMGTPIASSLWPLGIFWLLRHVVGDVARRRVAGKAYEPWIVSDLRVMGADLAVGVGCLTRTWSPPRLGGRPAGDRARWLLRGSQALTTALLIAVTTGFSRPATGDVAVLAAAGGATWFLGAGALSRHTLAKRQFRRSYRTDNELAVLAPAGIRLVGLSPTGFDLVSDVELASGSDCCVLVELPRAGGGHTPTELSGTIQRGASITAGWACYVAFGDLDAATVDAVHEYLAVASFGSGPSATASMGDTAHSA